MQQLLEEGEAMLETYKHPDPYILMWRPGGTMYHRNPPPVPEVSRLGCLSYLLLRDHERALAAGWCGGLMVA